LRFERWPRCSFEGSITGGTLTGTMKVELRIQSNGGSGGPVDGVQTATISLTLSKTSW
jgi:hypothetical protein